MVRPYRSPVGWEIVRAVVWLVIGLALVLLLGGQRPVEHALAERADAAAGP